jgi:hypothetical protein
MNRIPLLFAALLLGTGRDAHAQQTNSSSRLDFPAFNIIAERNIFNPNRSKGSAGNMTRTRPDESRRKTEAFALRGTMSYEKGRYAFFEGSSSDYRKALQVAENIAGYKVTEIGPDFVKLESQGKQVDLRLGMQMKKQEKGEWLLGSGTEAFESPTSTGASSDNSPSQPGEKAESGGGGAVSDILKKLREKREQEMKNENPSEESKKSAEKVQNEKP